MGPRRTVEDDDIRVIIPPVIYCDIVIMICIIVVMVCIIIICSASRIAGAFICSSIRGGSVRGAI